MPQLKSKFSLNKAAILVTTGIVISGCNTTSQSEHTAGVNPVPIAAESSAHTGEKGLSHDKLMSIAARAWERRNVSTALRLYNMAIQKKPNDITPYLAMAKILRKTKRTDAAIEIYNGLLEHQPKLVEAHTGLGYSLLDLSKPYIAAQSFETAIKIDPKNGRSLGGMAVALDTAGEHEKAQDYYRLAIKADTNNLIYQNNLALSLALVGRLDQAIAMFEIITAHPNAIAQHRQNLALVYGMAGKSADAMRYSRMDLSESDARNNALYFEALNSDPSTSPSQEEGQAMMLKNKQLLAKRRPIETTRQPYEPLIARSNFEELKTRPEPALEAEETPRIIQQNNEVRHARVPLTAQELVASTRTDRPVAQKVAAAPVSPVENSQLNKPKAPLAAEVQSLAQNTDVIAVLPNSNKLHKLDESQTSSPAHIKEKTVAVKSTANVSTHAYFAQLGSFRSVERAKIGWAQLLETHFDLLADHQPVFSKADLGVEKGIFYRVRIGGFTNKKTPLVICQQLRDRAQDCYMPITSAKSLKIIDTRSKTKDSTFQNLREVNLESGAPSGAPFLISYNKERVANSKALYSTMASY